MDIVQEALQFEAQTTRFSSLNDRIVASQKAKQLILALNQLYKKNKDANLMEQMKRLTAIKRKAEKRLNAKLVL
jgi:hypothetical protein